MSVTVKYPHIPWSWADALNDVLSEKWAQLRGIEIVSFGVNSMKASEEDEKMIKDLQKSAVLRNPNMAAATLVGAQAEAMKAAASNTSTGPMMAFAGMNMATQAGGMNAQQLFQMGAAQQAAPTQQAAPAQAAPAQTAAASQTGDSWTWQLRGSQYWQVLCRMRSQKAGREWLDLQLWYHK